MAQSSPDSAALQPRHLFGLAIVVTLVQVVGTALAAGVEPPQLDVLGYGLLAGSGLALIQRRRTPVLALLVVAGATVAYQVLDYPSGPTVIAAIVATLAGMRAGQHRPVWAVGAAAYGAWVVFGDAPIGSALLLGVVLLAGGAFAEFLLFALKNMARMAQEQHRLGQERKRRQVSEERLRIAQELHDVLGHHLSLINVRAAVGLHLLDRQPDEARDALHTIKQASDEALREVQSVIVSLYPDGEAAQRAPAPGLDRLADLTANAGLVVRTKLMGGPRPLPAEIDRAAYRIVQEALTNVRRHAGSGARATVTIDYGAAGESLTLQIDDDGGTAGPVAAPDVEGNGITGMRERAVALGGSLTAWPLAGTGWRVRAVLPLPGEEQA